ncbi:TatD family hydrolase [Guyparkeria hydrothermalis]|uniref:TatD family hydrolase n=1 Tax=Guyparkeria hydrothermalis TaxID=923 RepID=UPI0020224EAE|nr:TatD family hydrolase [Guyparkeria hydrothermalis]MCL7743773.1 TatD family hydrolase [Guyparkeria hydrothermalis]
MELIDTHCHLDAAAFADDLPAVMRHAVEQGVAGVVAVGVSPMDFSAQCRAITQARRAGLSAWAAFGTHPWWANRVDPAEAVDGLEAQWAGAERPVAVGEVGLDFARDDIETEQQNALFTAQLDWAAERDLPVILHEQKSADRLLYWLRRRRHAGGVVHGFTGSQQQAEQFIEQGFFIGVGGAITHPGAHRMHRMMRELPLDSLVLETDAPNQPGHAHRGERNRPGYLPENLTALASLRGLDEGQLREAIARNVERLFKGRLRYNAAG